MERRLAYAVLWALVAKGVLASVMLFGLGSEPRGAVAAEAARRERSVKESDRARPRGELTALDQELIRQSRGLRELLQAIGRRQKELDAREAKLAQREKDLELVEGRVSAKVARLEALEKKLAARKGPPAAQVLAKIYATMKPEQAAPILDRLDEKTVEKIFSRMRERQVAAIMALMDRDRAVTLTRLLAKRP